ncbi:MAG TPA: DUF5995 family protein [Anaerolineales bacterium]
MTVQRPITERMQTQIHEWTRAYDRRAIFLNCYMFMTRNMLAAIESGEFHDPAWIRQLLHRFADYYFEALEAYEKRSPKTPKVWRRVHDVTQEEPIAVLQHLLLGINAHINYDLVLTLVELLEGEWKGLDKPMRALRYADHCHVNAIIARTIDSVQDQVVEIFVPKMDLVDRLLGPFDEWMASRLITHWREEVWQHAILLLESRGDAESLRIRQYIEQETLKRAAAILFEDGPVAISSLI